MTKFGIGQAVRRVEDQRFATGAGQYVGDFSLPRQCYGVAVLTPHAHAAIKRVDVTAANAAPGVIAVLTGADAFDRQIGGIPPFFMPNPGADPKGFRPRVRFSLRTASVAWVTGSLLSLLKPKCRPATPPSWSPWTMTCCPRLSISSERCSRRRRKPGRTAQTAISG